MHNSKEAVAFLRELIESLRGRLGRALPLEFRMDAAFCQRDVFRLLAARRCAYASKVGYWSWLPLKALAAARQRWEALAPDVAGFMADLAIPQWNLQLRVMLYRKHVQHETPKNFQLDLFTTRSLSNRPCTASPASSRYRSFRKSFGAFGSVLCTSGRLRGPTRVIN